MVDDAYGFWHKHFASSGPLSSDYLLGRQVVIVKDAAAARAVFEECSEDRPLALHPSAVSLLAADNLAFLNGDGHRALRKPLLTLLAPGALAAYLTVQERCIRSALKRWSTPASNVVPGVMIRPLVFDLNTETSLRAFLGDSHIKDDAELKELQQALATFTKGFLGLPLSLPGTQLYEARKAGALLKRRIAGMVTKSQKEPGPPLLGTDRQSLLDAWVGSGATETLDADHVAGVVLDLLFASQDASTSSLTNAVHYLSLNSSIVAKVRAECASHDVQKPGFTLDRLAELPYANSVAREILRIRPPATIVPHAAVKAGPLSTRLSQRKGSAGADRKADDRASAACCDVSSGALIVPSIWNANREGHADPERFDPERPRGPAWLTFGAGPHMCIGQTYATNQLRLFIALLCDGYDFERSQTPQMHDLVYAPTIFPADGCPLNFLRPRANT